MVSDTTCCSWPSSSANYGLGHQLLQMAKLVSKQWSRAPPVAAGRVRQQTMVSGTICCRWPSSSANNGLGHHLLQLVELVSKLLSRAPPAAAGRVSQQTIVTSFPEQPSRAGRVASEQPSRACRVDSEHPSRTVHCAPLYIYIIQYTEKFSTMDRIVSSLSWVVSQLCSIVF